MSYSISEAAGILHCTELDIHNALKSEEIRPQSHFELPTPGTINLTKKGLIRVALLLKSEVGIQLRQKAENVLTISELSQ